ncbi:integral membrane protein [Clostridium botulinum]|nr:integral membrane protein [Clostridium botulinum]
MVKAIWFALIILAVWFGIILFKDFMKHKDNLENVSWGKTAIIGFIVNFF